MSLSEAEALARRLPKLLLAAERLAATANPGQHNRRRAGAGDAFWQFRPFAQGDETRRIDWRRSARADALMIRERESETATTLLVHLHNNAGLAFRSAKHLPTKQDSALLLLLATASLVLRAGDRIAVSGAPTTFAGRTALPKLAQHLINESPAPPSSTQRRIEAGDFLRPGQTFTGPPGGAVLHILDPAEQNFCYRGRAIFSGYGHEPPCEANAAEDWAAAYKTRITAQCDMVRSAAERAGQAYIFHSTASPPEEALAAIHKALRKK
jgi:uncharacterized protein (DUF58 family)